MVTKESYENRLKAFLESKEVSNNKDLFKEFFEQEEYKLKRMNGLKEIDKSSYITLYCYITMFKNIVKWFNGKDLSKLTEAEIKQVYDDLEDGKILTFKGKRFEDRISYYNKVFKGMLFEMAGIKDITKKIIDRNGTLKEKIIVKYITESDFKKLVEYTSHPKYKCLMWLAWDIGENVNSLLQLRKKDCIPQRDELTNNPEYRINLRKEILKRSRTSRGELTNYKETVEFLDYVLKDKSDSDFVFDFDYSASVKSLKRAVKMANVKCLPNGEIPSWKDLRSSMACDLLNKDWTTDEVNKRLGHKPSSQEIDKYVNFLAVDGKKPQRKVYEHNLAKIEAELKEGKEKERLYNLRIEQEQRERLELQKRLTKMEERFNEMLNEKVKVLRSKYPEAELKKK